MPKTLPIALLLCLLSLVSRAEANRGPRAVVQGKQGAKAKAKSQAFNRVAPTRHRLKQKTKKWDTQNFSKPKEGRVTEFTFLVTGTSMDLARTRVSENGTLAMQLTWASLITSASGKNKTIRNSGLILDAKHDNVIANYPTDTGWYSREDKYVSQETKIKQTQNAYPGDKPGNGGFFGSNSRPLGQKLPRYSPKKLVRKTGPGHNEVVLAGVGTKGSALRVSGFFIRLDAKGNQLIDAKEAKAIHAFAKELGVPVVRIPSEN